MRVLLSAYACEPNRGSEPEVGWQRALHMTERADEVWVLTRANNRTVIEADSRSHSPGLKFLYYDLPRWVLKLKKQAWFFPIYLILWQWGAYRLAARLHRDKPFDRVFHVTFVSMVAGSFMGRLGIPFVVGPIAGGERAPLRLRRGMTLRGQAAEFLRDLKILLQRYSPFTHCALAAAECIYVTTPDSLRLVRPRWRHKTRVQLAVAMDAATRPLSAPQSLQPPRFVFAGRLLHWKGVHLAIRALAETAGKLPGITLTIIGDGPERSWLQSVAERHGVAGAVQFAGQVARQQFVDCLPGYTALVFPSLHDSGGFVVLEALSAGLPVVCLDRGGPGVMVNESCGVVIPTISADEAQIVTRIADAMISLGTMPAAELERLSRGAVARAGELSWSSLTAILAARSPRITA